MPGRVLWEVDTRRPGTGVSWPLAAGADVRTSRSAVFCWRGPISMAVSWMANDGVWTRSAHPIDRLPCTMADRPP